MKAADLTPEHAGTCLRVGEHTGRLRAVVEGGGQPPLPPPWWLIVLLPDGADRVVRIRCDDTTEVTLVRGAA